MSLFISCVYNRQISLYILMHYTYHIRGNFHQEKNIANITNVCNGENYFSEYFSTLCIEWSTHYFLQGLCAVGEIDFCELFVTIRSVSHWRNLVGYGIK